MKKLKIAFLICIIIMLNLQIVNVSATGISNATMSQIANNIGTQSQKKYAKSTVMCTAYSISYCRAYLYDDYRQPTVFWGSGGANWSKGGGTKTTYRSNSQVLSAIKAQIDVGKPCIVRVNSGSGGHCVVAFSYSGNGTSTGDFTIIDPWSAKIKTLNKYTIHSSNKYVVTFDMAKTSMSTNTAQIKEPSWLFDAIYYSVKYPDLNRAFGFNEIALKNHWEQYGKKEGRSPSPLYDPPYYKTNNADLESAFGNNYTGLYNHFLEYGIKEFRASSPIYYGDFYKKNYADLQIAFGDDAYSYMQHFLNYGMKEGRQASKNFNVINYKNRYSDLSNTYGNNLEGYYYHYMEYGIHEGRICK